MWELLPSAVSFDALAAEFAEHCGISPDQADTDVRSTWADWRKGLFAPAADTSLAYTTESETAEPFFTEEYRLDGRRFRVLAGDEEIHSELAPRLDPLRCTAQQGTPSFTFQVTREADGVAVRRGPECLGIEESASAARIVLLQEMTRLCRPGREWLAVLHAAACASGDRCVLLAAGTQAGKSTLSAALMHSGLTCLSDDSAPIERGTLRVAGMPFALMLRDGSWPVLRSRFPDLENSPVISRYGQSVRFLPANIRDGASATAAPQAIVFSGYAAGAATELTSLGEFERLICLQESGLWVPHDEASIAAFLDWIAGLPAYRMIYSDLNEAVTAIRDVLHA